jgi:hypothetical protein
MTEFFHDYAFANFPRAVLPAITDRRHFFQDLVTDLKVSRTDQKIHPAYRLADLGIMPDTQLVKIVPLMLPGVQITTKGGFLWGCTPGESEPKKLFPESTPAVSVLHGFDGLNTIAFVGSSLALETGWTKEIAFAYTRGVFLWLVLARLVIPKDERQQ